MPGNWGWPQWAVPSHAPHLPPLPEHLEGPGLKAKEAESSPKPAHWRVSSGNWKKTQLFGSFGDTESGSLKISTPFYLTLKAWFELQSGQPDLEKVFSTFLTRRIMRDYLLGNSATWVLSVLCLSSTLEVTWSPCDILRPLRVLIADSIANRVVWPAP